MAGKKEKFSMKKSSKERYLLEDVCLGCKHTWEDHFITNKNRQAWCGFEKGLEYCLCKNFVLDNLKHLEIYAKARGLI